MLAAEVGLGGGSNTCNVYEGMKYEVSPHRLSDLLVIVHSLIDTWVMFNGLKGELGDL